MRIRPSVLSACVALGLAASLGVAQPPPDGRGGGRGGFGGGRGGFGGDPNQMFDRFSGGKDVIRRADLTDPGQQMMFDRLADRLKIANGEITREQFVGMMRDRGRRGDRGGPPGGGPPAGGAAPGAGGPPGGGGEADRSAEWAEAMFRRLDQNGDGVLNYDEMPEALRAEREKWDTDGNGLIDLSEFKAYFQARVQQFLIDRGGQGGWGGQGWGDPGQAPAAPPEPEVKKPVVYRAGNLPKDIPAWFDQLDTDRDGQIGLYEWRAAGRSIEEFQKMDRNGDGFLTPDEVLFYQQHNGGGAAETALAARPGGPGGNGGDAASSSPADAGNGNSQMANAGPGGGRNGGPGGGPPNWRNGRGGRNGPGGGDGRQAGGFGGRRNGGGRNGGQGGGQNGGRG
jgi:hypothetical protein